MTTYLKDFAHFTNTLDLDEAARCHVIENWNDMNPTDRAVLDMIRRYSAKYGAAHLKHDTMENAIGKSNVTVRRAIRKLEKLDIIERIHYIRPVMNGLGANIYTILPFDDQSTLTTPATADKLSGTKAEEDVPEPEAFSSKSKNTKTNTLTDTYPAEPTPTRLFGRMKSLLSTTIGDSSSESQLFGIHRAQSLRMMIFLWNMMWRWKDFYFDEWYGMHNDTGFMVRRHHVFWNRRYSPFDGRHSKNNPF